MQRIAALVVAVALVVVSCGGDDTPEGIMTLIVTPESDGRTVTLWVGDELAPQLPAAGPEDPLWALAGPPDPAVLAGGDSFVFVPSVEAFGDPYVEFSFQAAGAGTTVLEFESDADSADTITFTVQVNDR